MTTKQPEPQTAGSLILAQLERLDMSQATLARETGLSFKHVISLIKGRSRITPETAVRLEVLGLSAVEIMQWDANYRVWAVRQRRREAT